MGHDDVVLRSLNIHSYFRGLMGNQWDPRVLGFQNLVLEHRCTIT